MSKPEAKSQELFLKLGADRVNKTLARIRQIGHLATYKHEPAQAEKMFKALRDCVNQTEQRFKKGIAVEGFAFDEPKTEGDDKQ